MGRISPLLLLSRYRCHRLKVSKECATNLFELNLMIVSLNPYTVFIHIHPQRAASVSFFFFFLSLVGGGLWRLLEGMGAWKKRICADCTLLCLLSVPDINIWCDYLQDEKKGHVLVLIFFAIDHIWL